MNSPTTLTQLFFEAIDRYSSKDAALRYKQGGKWHGITHQQLARSVHHAAVGLWELGISPGDKVAILSPNRPEWAIADYACLTARCASVPIYATVPSDQVAYVIQDSRANALFVADLAQYRKIADCRNTLPDLKQIICFDAPLEKMGVMSFQELLQTGAAAENKYPDYKRDACAVDKDYLATVIYTSGTTGNPKGVMTTHHNITSNIDAVLRVLKIGPEDSCLSLLPLSHTFERMAGHFTMLHAGTTISYADSIDRVPANLLEVKPTIVLTIPRLFERIYGRVLENAVGSGSLRRRLFFWARRTAEQHADLKLAQKPVPGGLAFKARAADRLVFSNIRAKTGGRIRFFISGGAPLSPDIARFFFAAGLPILEGYGITETSPVITVNPLEEPHLGTVGPAIPGVEVRVSADGEILVRGPNVMAGYINNPAATAEVVDSDGWFHTGDIGKFDAGGYLMITDRKKDILVTAGGESIAPLPIENLVKNNKYVADALLIGDEREFPSILVAPNVDALEQWATGQNILADPGMFLKHPEVVEKLEQEVLGCLGDLPNHEIPRKVLVIERGFSVEEGELTPTMKVKRRVVEEKYSGLIEELYST